MKPIRSDFELLRFSIVPAKASTTTPAPNGGSVPRSCLKTLAGDQTRTVASDGSYLLLNEYRTKSEQMQGAVELCSDKVIDLTWVELAGGGPNQTVSERASS